ncbi:hypothetical protein C2U56_16080 [Pseudomonas fluorescens]|nr:hypothetical protein C2U56_16080 [Pseudomonas fluorescens]
MIAPTLRVGMPLSTLRVTLWDAERPGMHSHAERGNDQCGSWLACDSITSVSLIHQGACIAGKPAPTL